MTPHRVTTARTITFTIAAALLAAAGCNSADKQDDELALAPEPMPEPTRWMLTSVSPIEPVEQRFIGHWRLDQEAVRAQFEERMEQARAEGNQQAIQAGAQAQAFLSALDFRLRVTPNREVYRDPASDAGFGGTRGFWNPDGEDGKLTFTVGSAEGSLEFMPNGSVRSVETLGGQSLSFVYRAEGASAMDVAIIGALEEPEGSLVLGFDGAFQLQVSGGAYEAEKILGVWSVAPDGSMNFTALGSDTDITIISGEQGDGTVSLEVSRMPKEAVEPQIVTMTFESAG